MRIEHRGGKRGEGGGKGRGEKMEVFFFRQINRLCNKVQKNYIAGKQYKAEIRRR